MACTGKLHYTHVTTDRGQTKGRLTKSKTIISVVLYVVSYVLPW